MCINKHGGIYASFYSLTSPASTQCRCLGRIATPNFRGVVRPPPYELWTLAIAMRPHCSPDACVKSAELKSAGKKKIILRYPNLRYCQFAQRKKKISQNDPPVPDNKKEACLVVMGGESARVMMCAGFLMVYLTHGFMDSD